MNRRLPFSWLKTGSILLVCASLSACALFHPRWTGPEKAALNFNLQGIEMGSPPTNLKIFTQVQKTPPTPDGKVVYQIFNPNAHISTAIFWYEANRLRQMELRYYDASGVRTLDISGGWLGLRKTMFDDFGPPSQFGPTVPVVATQAGLDPKTAQFNGVWDFSRVGRQINYIAMADATAGVAVVTIADTTPLKKKQKPKKAFKTEQPPPPATSPGPGFSTSARFL